ncbi:MAG TPA: hypothetical protein VGE11_00245 [Pseudonocardia sp.]
MTQNPADAPDPDSDEFLGQQNPVEKLSPDTTADAPATDPTLIPTDPTTSADAGPNG